MRSASSAQLPASGPASTVARSARGTNDSTPCAVTRDGAPGTPEGVSTTAYAGERSSTSTFDQNRIRSR